MSESYWAYWLVLLGVVFTVIMMLIQSVTTSNTQDYYQLKEVTESAMVDAVDYAYYRLYGEVKINKEKFVENFIRRFAETVSITTTYQIDFYDLYEAPPKVSVKVKSLSNSFNIVGDETSFNVVNKLDAILETNVNSGPNGGMCSYYSEDHDDDYDDTNPEDEGGEETPGPTDDDGGGDEDCDKCDDKFKDDDEDPVDPEPEEPEDPDDPEDPEKPDDPKLNICMEGITSFELKGMQGTSMSNDNLVKRALNGSDDYCMKASSECKNAYYTDYNLNEVKGFAKPGDVFTINGSRGEWWSIEFTNGNCGWVDSTYMAINLRDYLPKGKVEFNIYNADASQYKINGVSITGLTGKKLYTDNFSSFVPATYSFAKQLKKAVSNTNRRLVIYDAYRPYSVTKLMYRQYQNFRSERPDLFAQYVDVDGWGTNWFVATTASKHNTGCAVDISFAEAKMPSEMHEVSVKAVILKSPNGTDWSEGFANSSDARDLYKLMTDNSNNGPGLESLKSEWWHYQSTGCHNTIKSANDGNGLDFWSNVLY